MPNQHESSPSYLKYAAAGLVGAVAFAGFNGEARGRVAEEAFGADIEAVGAHPADLAPEALLIEQGEQGSDLTPEQFNYAKRILSRFNNGPPEMNVIETGGLLLMSGTRVYKAPMKGAIDHVIDNKHFEFWAMERLMPLKDGLWAAAREIHPEGNSWNVGRGTDYATDPHLYSWVKISEAQKVKGFGHYELTDPNDLSKRWNLPHVYAVRPDNQFNLEIAQSHPAELAVPSLFLGTYIINERSHYRKNSLQFGAYDKTFKRTSRPVKFEKAKLTR